MPSFSKVSGERLATCHPDLQRLFNAVVEHYDCSILEGHRGKERQEQMVSEGKSKVHWPNGKHNTQPSEAVDVAPYPVDWADTPLVRARFYHFAGFVLRTANELGVKVRWGGDWNSNNVFTDQSFHDLPHWELVL